VKRLQTRHQFQFALSGQALARSQHFVLHSKALDAGTEGNESETFQERAVWLGAMVPKRWAKRAVTRNTIRRQIYAVSACYEAAFSERAQVVRLRAEFDRALFPSATSQALVSAVKAELHLLFANLQSAAPTSTKP
jgi:ribonuclease P protein component